MQEFGIATSPQAPPALTLDESVQMTHAAASRIENLIDALWSDITGEPCGKQGVPTSGPAPSAGLARDAQRAGDRLHGSADRLEAIRARIVARNVVEMNNGANTANGRPNF